MATQSGLREKLGKIEVLFSGAATAGERSAAEAASARLKAKLAEMERNDRPTEVRISIDDAWSRQLFVALCRRYGLKPYRYARERTTVVVRAPRRFVDEVLWRQFRSIDGELRAYLSDVTLKVIRDEICADTSDAPEILEALTAA